jgi:hypothetical protein
MLFRQLELDKWTLWLRNQAQGESELVSCVRIRYDLSVGSRLTQGKVNDSMRGMAFFVAPLPYIQLHFIYV